MFLLMVLVGLNTQANNTSTMSYFNVKVRIENQCAVRTHRSPVRKVQPHHNNQSFEDWDALFTDTTMTVAAIDRLARHSYITQLQGESYRRKSAIK
jgi:hypothetical protein